jgi:hypothetical protein
MQKASPTSGGKIADNPRVKPKRRSLMRIYGPPAAIAAMGALWMWGDVGPSMRGVIYVCALVIVLSLFVGARSDRRTRKRLAETERQLDVLRTRGYEALREELHERKGKDAA